MRSKSLLLLGISRLEFWARTAFPPNLVVPEPVASVIECVTRRVFARNPRTHYSEDAAHHPANPALPESLGSAQTVGGTACSGGVRQHDGDVI